MAAYRILAVLSSEKRKKKPTKVTCRLFPLGTPTTPFLFRFAVFAVVHKEHSVPLLVNIGTCRAICCGRQKIKNKIDILLMLDTMRHPI